MWTVFTPALATSPASRATVVDNRATPQHLPALAVEPDILACFADELEAIGVAGERTPEQPVTGFQMASVHSIADWSLIGRLSDAARG